MFAGDGDAEHASQAQHTLRSTQRPPFGGYVPLPALPASAEGSVRSTSCPAQRSASDINWSSCPGKLPGVPVDTSGLAARPPAPPNGLQTADSEDAAAARAAAEHSAKVAERVSKLRLNLPLKDHAQTREDNKAANAEVMASLHRSMQSKHALSRQHSQRSRHSMQPSHRARTDINRRSMHSAVSSGRRSVSTSVALSHQDVLEDGVKVRTESTRLRRQVSGFGVNSMVRAYTLPQNPP